MSSTFVSGGGGSAYPSCSNGGKLTGGGGTTGANGSGKQPPKTGSCRGHRSLACGEQGGDGPSKFLPAANPRSPNIECKSSSLIVLGQSVTFVVAERSAPSTS